MSNGATLLPGMPLGYYSVVQYVDQVGRREPINVGVVVTCQGRVETAFSERPEVEEPAVVQRFAETLDYIFEHELPLSPGRERASLDELAHRRFSRFSVSDPRPVDISNISAALDELLELYATPNGRSIHF